MVLVAVAYFPFRMPSDKQFIYDLIEHLPKHIVPAVWTVRADASGVETQATLQQTVSLVHVTRFLHKVNRGENGAYVADIRHGPIRTRIEVGVSMAAGVLGNMGALLRDHNADVVHFVDYPGVLCIALLRKLYPHVRITCAKHTMILNGGKLVDIHHRLIRKAFSLTDKVIPYNKAVMQQLRAIGVGNNRMCLIPWGIPECPRGDERKVKEIRKRYGCTDTDTSLLFVGINRERKKDFLRRIAILNEMLKGLPIKIVFAVRKRLYSDIYRNVSSERVQIVRGPEDFDDLLEAADAVFSPPSKPNAPCMPPLAWIEAMKSATPIITSPHPGVDEIVIDARTGFIFETEAELARVFTQICDKRICRSLGQAAREFVTEKHSIKGIAEKYAQLWMSLLGKGI